MDNSREKNIQRRMTTCRHYNVAIRNKVCDAGVTYPQGPLPCIQLLCADPPSVEDRRWQCSKLDCYTREEAERDYDEATAASAKVMRVLRAISGWRTWTRDNPVAKAEVIECPECKGRLHLSQSGYNGHVWGKCETEGCVEWME